MKSILVALTATVCMASSISSDAGAWAGAPETGDSSGSSLSRYKDQTLAKFGPYDERRRWQTYVAMSELFDREWLHPKSRKVLKKGNVSSAGNMILELEDRDKDGKAEFYVFGPSDASRQTQDFGAYFDLNGDGRPDWIVFYGGSAFSKDKKLFWWHQHGIDTNGDGRFDVRVIGMIDADGDGFPEEEATAWVYDTDHDGLIDKAEHISNGRVTPIKPIDGFLPLGWVLNPKLANQPRIGEPTSGLFDLIAGEIDALSGSQKTGSS